MVTLPAPPTEDGPGRDSLGELEPRIRVQHRECALDAALIRAWVIKGPVAPAQGDRDACEHAAPVGVRPEHPGHDLAVHARPPRVVHLLAVEAHLGPALKTVAEVRRECLEIEVTKKSGDRAMSARGKTPTFAAFVAGPWKSACFDRYKPATRKSVRGSLRTQLLPAFGDLPLDRIDRLRVHRWFDEYSRTAPGGANHALDTFRRIMNHANALGHVEANPTRDVKPNPRVALTRFLSLEEIACLHRVLDGYASSRASRRRQADIIRLLLLTGCRKGEIVTLRWREVEGDTLNLADSKTGPRKVFLNTPARAVIERQPRTDSPFVFPSPRNPERACSPNLPLWYPVRRQAGIEDVRLHDLRHTFASHAVLRGIPLPVVSRLLGHKQPSMTLRYAHVGDRETEEAAERIGAAIAQELDGDAGSQHQATDSKRSYPRHQRTSMRYGPREAR